MTLFWKVSRYLSEHPVCTTALGLGPLVAKSATFLSALTISLGFTVVFLFSSISLALLRKLVPHRFRLVFILLICSVWVSVFDLLLQAYVYDMRVALEIYVPLLAMNSLMLMLLEKESLSTTVPGIAVRTLVMSVGPVFICLMTGLLREMFAHGAVLTDSRMLNIGSAETITSSGSVLPLFDTIAGAFILTGCILASLNYLCSTKAGNAMQANGDDRG